MGWQQGISSHRVSSACTSEKVTGKTDYAVTWALPWVVIGQRINIGGAWAFEHGLGTSLRAGASSLSFILKLLDVASFARGSEESPLGLGATSAISAALSLIMSGSVGSLCWCAARRLLRALGLGRSAK
jgi:hypothetical protein